MVPGTVCLSTRAFCILSMKWGLSPLSACAPGFRVGWRGGGGRVCLLSVLLLYPEQLPLLTWLWSPCTSSWYLSLLTLEGGAFPHGVIMFLLEAIELPQHCPHQIHFSRPGPQRGLLVPGLETNTGPSLPKINSLLAVFSSLLTLGWDVWLPPMSWTSLRPRLRLGLLSGLPSPRGPSCSGERLLLPTWHQTFFWTLPAVSGQLPALGALIPVQAPCPVASHVLAAWV